MKTLQKVRERFYWNNVRSVEEKCCTRDCCAVRKGPRKRTRIIRWQQYLGGAGLLHTKWPEACPISDQEASTVAEVQHWISRFGVPLQLQSNQGRNLTVQFARDCVKYSPSTKLGQRLCILSLTAWYRGVPFMRPPAIPHPRCSLDVVFVCLQIFCSAEPDAPLAPEEYVEKLQVRMEEIHHLARERIGLASEKMKTRYDARAAGHDFHEGDKLWLWIPKR
ncbi:retrovirus-related Pol polyprotein from transposon 412 [Trichonephila clavipes]|nr:retrovirus-related Pol polyprotein from transposon 412 [Trichonephila clavipes]